MPRHIQLCLWVPAESCSTLLWPHGLLPTRLLCPWNFLGRNTGVHCCFLLQGTFPDSRIKPVSHVSGIGRWALYCCTAWEAHIQLCVLSHLVVSSSFVNPWAVAYQAPLCTEFSRQEYWSRLPFPSPGIFPTQGLNSVLLHCRQILYHLSHQGSLYPAWFLQNNLPSDLPSDSKKL